MKDILWGQFLDWSIDWHFQTSIGVLFSMTSNSRLWNIILMMYGMNIDLSSRIAGIGSFVPSKVDLVSVKNSFISVVTFSTKTNDHYRQVIVENSSIGNLAHLNPTDSELRISGAVVPPITHVMDNMISQPKQDSCNMKFSTWELAQEEMLISMGYMLCFCILFCTLIPSYELWINVFGDPTSIFVIVLAFASALVVQTLIWTIALACVQYVALINSRYLGNPMSNAIFALYGTMAFAYQDYSFLKTLLGSPSFNMFMKFLGVKIEGQTLLFPHRIFEHSHITIASNTIIDAAHVSGHYVVYNDVVLGPCYISGVMHEGSYAASAYITSKESDSWRASVGTTSEEHLSATESTRQSLSTL